jgi:hypothetical protein
MASVVEKPPKPPPSRSEQQAFDTLRDDAQRAAEEEDWDAFLDKNAKALEALGEQESTRAVRREAAYEVGNYRVEARNVAQIHLSVELLRRYKDQLSAAYGSAAPGTAEWIKVDGYIDELLALTAGNEDTRAEPPPVEASPPAQGQPIDADRQPSHRVEPLVVSGGILTGVGGVLLVSGFAFYGSQYVKYEDLRDQHDAGQPVDPAEADKVYRRISASWGITVPGAVLLAAGIGLLVVGLRRRQYEKQRRTSFGLGQVEVHF